MEHAPETATLPSLYDLTYDALVDELVAAGEKKFRAQQVFEWAHKRFPTPFDEMTNLSKALRESLAERYRQERLDIAAQATSRDGSTKYLFSLPDGAQVESVVMPMGSHTTICISTQVGCKMGCAFCVTGKMGFKRNLSPSEIVLQFHEATAQGHHIQNIVLMGMGEPLDNWENVATALDILTHDKGANVTERRITLSTVGLSARLPEVMERFPRLNIAVSLVAAEQNLRRELLPVARKYPLDDLMKTCRDLPVVHRKRITFEYVMLPGINDRPDDVRALAKELGRMRCKLNLIPFNPAPSIPYGRPTEAAVNHFASELTKRGLTVTVRWSKAVDIQGACGQLAERSA